MNRPPVLKRLEEDLIRLERELRIDIPKELQEAVAHGDLRENAEYSAAKERQSFLQARIAQLRSRIDSLSSLKIEALPRDRVAFGARVTLKDIDNGGESVYELVTPEEVNPAEGKISVNSPVGKSLLGKTKGDEVVVSIPSGERVYEIISIITLHDMLEG